MSVDQSELLKQRAVVEYYQEDSEIETDLDAY